jgi:hypothetical protein
MLTKSIEICWLPYADRAVDRERDLVRVPKRFEASLALL